MKKDKYRSKFNETSINISIINLLICFCLNRETVM